MTLLRTLPAALLALILGTSPALAQDVEPDETVTGKAPPKKADPKVVEESKTPPPLADTTPKELVGLSMEQVKSLPYPVEIYHAATILGLESEFLGEAWKGTQHVYARRYRDARDHFDGMQKRWPGRGVAHIGGVLIHQSAMMENFDFRGESQYKLHSKEAIRELEDALKVPGHEAWEHFLLGMAKGIEAIHGMRRSEFVSSLARGMDAMDHVEQAQKAAPRFYDPLLGTGLYQYWRSVVTLNSKALPDWEDHRAEGINNMMIVESQGVFLAPGASLALAFTWIEERDMKRALAACLRNYRAYPDNVINNLVLARVYLYMRKYDDSLRILKEILADDPQNQRSHYYLSTVWLRKGDLMQAHAEIDRYLSFPLDKEVRAQALHRKGDIFLKQKDYKNAEKYFNEAVKLNGYKPSEARLEKLKKAGHI